MSSIFEGVVAKSGGTKCLQKGNRREEVIEAKPNPKKFKIVFRGYDIDEVDEFAEKYALADEVMADQKERIFRLVDENKKLEEELAEMKKAQGNVSMALLYANEKAAEIIADARKLADAEMERVRVFKSKWEFFAKKILGELAPAQRQTYERLSRRIDETLEKFASESEETPIAEVSVMAGKRKETATVRHEAEELTDAAGRNGNAESAGRENKGMGVKSAETGKPVPRAQSGKGTAPGHVIELNEVYETDESLENLIDDLI